jgi:hypothetical protein
MALKLDILANTRAFVQEMKKADASVEDISDALDDMAKDGAKAGEKLEASFKELSKASKKTGDAIGKNVKGGLDEAKDEAASSGREAAASFSGGLEDIADFAQETLANALGGFGPIGAAAGTALAVGLGAALSSLAAQQERIDAIRESARDLSETLYENKGVLPIAEEVSRAFDLLSSERAAQGIEGWINQWADLGTNMDQLATSARIAKTPVSDLVHALSGSDLPAAKRQLEAVEKALDKVNKKREFSSGTELFNNAADAQALEGTRKQLEDQVRLLEMVADEQGIVTDAYGDAGAAAEARAEKAKQAAADEKAGLDDLSSAWQNAATDAANYWVKDKEGVESFDWAAYLADAESTLAAADEYKRKIVTLPSDIAAEGKRVFETQGAKAAAAYISAYEGASAADKGRFENAARANGEAAGSAAAAGLKNTFGTPVLQSTVKVNVDDTAWRQWVPVKKDGRVEAFVMGTGRQVI